MTSYDYPDNHFVSNFALWQKNNVNNRRQIRQNYLTNGKLSVLLLKGNS